MVSITEQHSIQALRLVQLIFDESDIVSLKVETRIHHELRQVDLLFSFRQFNDLLRFTGEKGEQVQLIMSDKLLSNEQTPYIIGFENEEIVFSSCELWISSVFELHRSVYIVDEVQPLSLVKQSKNLKQNIKDFQSVKLENTPNLKIEILKIAKMYRYYRGLLELNVQEEDAREQSGLINDNLFKLAYYACHS